MKKIIAIFLALCLCGCSAKEVSSGKKPSEEAVFPPIPTQMPASNLPTTPRDGASVDAEDAEAADTTPETYPWETEFKEAGYTVLEEEFGEGRAITWAKGYKNARSIVYYDNGAIDDRYYYPSGSWSYWRSWGADGSYSEMHWLDNGDVETMSDGTKISQLGTLFYSKTIHTDGSWEETQYNSEGNIEFAICQLADGSYQETRYNSEGFPVLENMLDVDGHPREVRYDYYENGNLSKCSTDDSAEGTYTEEAYYESGRIEYRKTRTSEYEEQVCYDEEGFLTYIHTKRADYEIEMLTDENGKLVQAIENGQTIEDPTVLAEYVTSYNFRN